MKKNFSLAIAREIMGPNFFGPDDAKEYFGINYDFSFSFFDLSTERLKELKENWVLVWVPKMSIIDMSHSFECHISDRLSFTRHLGVTRWSLIKRNSAYFTSKTWGEQNSLLRDDEEVSDVRTMVYLTMVWYLKFNKNFSDVILRTSEKMGNYRIVVAQEDKSIFLGGSIPSKRYENVGLAVAKSTII